jgi:hypothetical protein
VRDDRADRHLSHGASNPAELGLRLNLGLCRPVGVVMDDEALPTRCVVSKSPASTCLIVGLPDAEARPLSGSTNTASAPTSPARARSCYACRLTERSRISPKVNAPTGSAPESSSAGANRRSHELHLRLGRRRVHRPRAPASGRVRRQPESPRQRRKGSSAPTRTRRCLSTNHFSGRSGRAVTETVSVAAPPHELATHTVVSGGRGLTGVRTKGRLDAGARYEQT